MSAWNCEYRVVVSSKAQLGSACAGVEACPHCESATVTKRGVDETQACLQRYHAQPSTDERSADRIPLHAILFSNKKSW